MSSVAFYVDQSEFDQNQMKYTLNEDFGEVSERKVWLCVNYYSIVISDKICLLLQTV